MLKIKGQSIFEYTTLAALVIVGTLIMGPYVVRSVGGHFKLWQEQVDDTANDRMLLDKTDHGLQCTYGPAMKHDDQCNTRLQGSKLCTPSQILKKGALCGKSQRRYYQTVEPEGCPFCDECRPDPTCCQQYNQSNPPDCGKMALTQRATDGVAAYRDGTGIVAGVPYTLSTDANTADDQGYFPAMSRNNPGEVLDFTDPTEVWWSQPINYCLYGEEVVYNNCFSHEHPDPNPTNPIAPIKCKKNDSCKPVCTNKTQYPRTYVCGETGAKPWVLDNYLTANTDVTFKDSDENFTYYKEFLETVTKSVDFPTPAMVTATGNGMAMGLICDCPNNHVLDPNNPTAAKWALPGDAGIVKPTSFTAIGIAKPTGMSAVDFIAFKLAVSQDIYNTLASSSLHSPYIVDNSGIGTIQPSFYDLVNYVGLNLTNGIYYNNYKVSTLRLNIYNILDQAPAPGGFPPNRLCHITGTVPQLDCSITTDITFYKPNAKYPAIGKIPYTDEAKVDANTVQTLPATKWIKGSPPNKTDPDTHDLGIGVEYHRKPTTKSTVYEYNKYHYWVKVTHTSSTVAKACPNYPAEPYHAKCIAKCSTGLILTPVGSTYVCKLPACKHIATVDGTLYYGPGKDSLTLDCPNGWFIKGGGNDSQKACDGSGENDDSIGYYCTGTSLGICYWNVTYDSAKLTCDTDGHSCGSQWDPNKDDCYNEDCYCRDANRVWINCCPNGTL